MTRRRHPESTANTRVRSWGAPFRGFGQTWNGTCPPCGIVRTRVTALLSCPPSPQPLAPPVFSPSPWFHLLPECHCPGALPPRACSDWPLALSSACVRPRHGPSWLQGSRCGFSLCVAFPAPPPAPQFKRPLHPTAHVRHFFFVCSLPVSAPICGGVVCDSSHHEEQSSALGTCSVNVPEPNAGVT